MQLTVAFLAVLIQSSFGLVLTVRMDVQQAAIHPRFPLDEGLLIFLRFPLDEGCSFSVVCPLSPLGERVWVGFYCTSSSLPLLSSNKAASLAMSASLPPKEAFIALHIALGNKATTLDKMTVSHH